MIVERNRDNIENSLQLVSQEFLEMNTFSLIFNSNIRDHKTNLQ